jgi:1-deoxy-D-xylulose-5-phosphate synthase
MSGKFYAAAREGAKSVLKNTPLYEFARRFEEHTKGMVVPGTIFEEFGFNYVGPIDGHDLDSLIPTLENLRDKKGPQFLHVVTKKGYGYKLAEADPIKYHGPGKFDPQRGLHPAGHRAQAHLHPGVRPVAVRHGRGRRAPGGITPAMREGSGMVEFEQRFPKRYHDVGIAEQHAVTFAAGLACEGLKPVVAIYSTFLQRGYDQLIHDVALQNLPVVFALDRAGSSAPTAPPTAAPTTSPMCAACPTWHAHAVRRERMPPGADHRLSPQPPGGRALPARRRHRQAASRPTSTPCPGARANCDAVPVRSRCWASGWPSWPSAPCCTRRWPRPTSWTPRVANMRFAKPSMRRWCWNWRAPTTRWSRWKRAACPVAPAVRWVNAWPRPAVSVPLLHLGLPDEFIEHGDPAKLIAMVGLDAAGIEASVRKRFRAVAGEACGQRLMPLAIGGASGQSAGPWPEAFRRRQSAGTSMSGSSSPS